MTRYLSVDDVLEIAGVAAPGAVLIGASRLAGAVGRPQAGFDGVDLYRDLAAKAGALLHGLVTAHPFLDGNKRTGLLATLAFLGANGVEIGGVDHEMLYEMTIGAATGVLDEFDVAQLIEVLFTPPAP